jgi:hypothetical protein
MRKALLFAVLGFACFAATGVGAAVSAGTAADAGAAAASNTSYDGLQRRESKVFSDLWVRRYFDVRSYHKVIFMPPTVQYRPLMQAAQTDAKTLKASPLTKRQKDSLLEILNTAFRDELKQSKYFKLTDEPDLDVLTLRAGLVDVVSFVPANASGKNDPLTVPAVGEATLVLELYDSSSDAIMVRASEHVVAKHEADTKTAAEAVQATAKAWAAILRERLDAAASIPLNND